MNARHLQEKLNNLPESPGVYLMKNAQGDVIYVGKAAVLKNRVRQYFQPGGKKPGKVAAMVEEVCDIDYVITGSEKEALILECNLIKKHRPRFNILMKDDKHYPYVRIDVKEDFPRAEVVRSIRDDGARYFGPYLAAHTIRGVLDTLGRVFPLRTCGKDIARAIGRKERPCLQYEMHRCPAPCAGKISKEEYRKLVDEVLDFLSGRHHALIRQLEAEMDASARRLEYEKCAVLRDRLRAVREVMEKQRASFPDLNDKDVFALSRDGDEAVVQALFVRKGKLEYTERFYLVFGDETDGALIGYVLKQYYMGTPNVPRQVFAQAEPEDRETIESWLSEKRGGRVTLRVPRAGDNKKLVGLAELNAKEALKRRLVVRRREHERTVGACARLASRLGVPFIRRMECYDISNIQGTDSVGSMAVFTAGRPDNREYRHFRIKTVQGADDFASMAEVIERRFKRALKEAEDGGKADGWPQLVVVDGGKGQLHAAYDALCSLGLEDMPIIGLAKREEEVFLPFEKEPLLLDRKSDELQLLQRIRDEAHRFAVSYHRSLREKRVEASALDAIRGIGDKRKKALLKHFKSIRAIRSAGVEELSAVDGMDKKSARSVYEHFNR